MMDESHIISRLLPLHQYPGQIKFILYNSVSDTEQYQEYKTKEAMNRMAIIDVIIDLSSGNCRMVILCTVQINSKLLIGIIFIFIFKFCSIHTQYCKIVEGSRIIIRDLQCYFTIVICPQHTHTSIDYKQAKKYYP